MAKRKAKRTKKVVSRKKKISKKKAVKRLKVKVKAKPRKKAQAKAEAQVKEKILGKVDHFFGKISVAAIKVKAPFKVGDYIHIKGHTTDFVQKVESMQIEHQSVDRVKKGDDVGIKVKEHVRDHDVVYLAAKQEEAAVKPVESAGVPKPEPLPLSGEKKADPYGQTKFISF